jgi:hypothetical protein
MVDGKAYTAQVTKEVILAAGLSPDLILLVVLMSGKDP